MTPAEVCSIATSYGEREKRREREAWERVRWQTMCLMNVTGNLKHQIHDPKQLIRFPDEVSPPVDPEEQARLAEEHRQFHKQKFWMKLKTDEKGDIKIFNEGDYERLMKKSNN